MWIYDHKEFLIENRGDAIGFVYEITDKENNMSYIGKKGFFSTRKLQPLKGQKRKRKVVKESDWMDYYGSSEEVKLLVEQSGRERFERKILRLCATKGEMSYWELWHQMVNHVLFKPEKYYNAYVGARIHRKHVLKK